ncbi:MAG: type IV pilus twitching motility protein PilT [Clostridiaceae bacterium]|nr:type IV pilus twitching motility protein PilT [Clostridiaceae bacterium]
MNYDALLEYAATNQCSDIHLTEGRPPSFRRHGVLSEGTGRIVTQDDILDLLDDAQRFRFSGGHDLDFARSYGGRRQRVNVFRETSRVAASIRLLNDRIPSIEELNLPPAVGVLADEPRGLVLVTGPTGSGKSTTLAAMVNHISKSRACHILTIEDPIEYVYPPGRALIHQREVGRDTESFAASLRSALREDPDVILVGEMRDYETINAAVTAAETGHLVLSTLHTTGAARTVERIIGVFPSDGQAQIRSQLAGVLRGVVTQALLPKADGSGRIAATEVLIGTDAILNLIREGKGHQINSMLQAGGALGMHTLDGSLAQLVRGGMITRTTAEAVSPNPRDLAQLLSGR